MRVLLLVFFLLPLSSFAELKEYKLPTAADGQVSYFVDTETRLPIGVSDQYAEVITAALSLYTNRKPTQPLSWTWSYTIKFKTGVKVKSVLIEDEQRSELRTVIKDESPLMSYNIWSGEEELKELNEEMFQLMNAKGPWIQQRKITINYEDGSKSTLHQLIAESQAKRVALLDNLNKKMKELIEAK